MPAKPQNKIKPKGSAASRQFLSGTTQRGRWMYAGGVVLVTFIVLYPLLSADFLNWDDPTFVLGNRIITSINAKNIWAMFTTYAMGNYCPLVQLSYAADYMLAGGLHPFAFHLTSLLFHLGNTFLVFVLVYRLSGNKVIPATVASLLFGIHPMHLESVAWIAERRDVMYTFFYLLGLLAYTDPANRKGESKTLSARGYVSTLVLFLFSLLCKGQAVTFPLAMLAVDYIQGRKLDKKCFIEKIPFFLLALGFGILAVVAQRTTPTFNPMHIALWHTPFVAAYGLLLYLVKSVIPFMLSGYHPYPFSSTTEAPVMVFMAPFIIIALAVLVYKKWRNQPVIIGGLLFFLLTIAPVLQFMPVGETIISERYSYVPYIGLFIIAGNLAGGKINIPTGARALLMAGIWVWIGVLCFITHSRTAVWKEPVGFWTDVIDKYPACHIAYNNRGYLYNDFGQYDKAIADFDKGIALSPDYGRLYLNRGLSYYRMKDYDKAFADYSMAIKLDTTEPQSYINRGTMYTDLYGKYDLGIADFHKALRLEPDNEDISANMGVAFYKKGVYDSAIYYYTKSITIYPAAKTYLMRALAYGALKEFDKARQDAGKAKEMGMDIDEATLNSWK